MEIKWNPEMKKPMKIMLIALGILFGGIFLYKSVMGFFIKRYFESQKNPVITVSTAVVGYAPWQPTLKAVGSTRATRGVNVTAQRAGMITHIYLTSSALVQEGDVLVQQNADPNIAQLNSLKAQAELAKITYQRDKAQYRVKAISKQQVDADEQNLKSLQAQVAEQVAIVDQLTIKAPFSGRLGISKVNPGQYLQPGDTVVPLQRLDPIYVDFYVPQRFLAQLHVNQAVTVTTDTFPGQSFSGNITTINPIVDVGSRNVEVEATLPNPKLQLYPGMYTTVVVTVQKPQPYLTVPQSAISFNAYGDIVFVVHEKGKDKKGNPILVANQVFVTTGETRGDQITILKGIKAGDTIVTSGQLKLKNGSLISINNAIQPQNDPAPRVANEHEG